MITPPWLITQTKQGKTAVKSALYMGVYDEAINYDSLADFCKISEDATLNEIHPHIKDYQTEYKAEFLKTSSGIDTTLNTPTDISTENTEKSQDQNKKSVKKRGRKNQGLTELHKREYNERRAKRKTEIRQTQNAISFNDSIIERVQADVVNDSDIENFRELYMLTCSDILERFKNENPELVKKHPYTWFKNLLIELKKNVPSVSYMDIDKLFVVWDALAYVLKSIGLYPTYETFQDFTKIYDYQLKKQEELNPKYRELMQKIINERNNALLTELAFNPYNQTNKIFLAKVNGFVEKTEPKQIEVVHTIPQFENIERYKLEEK